jgi:hypothetical protein
MLCDGFYCNRAASIRSHVIRIVERKDSLHENERQNETRLVTRRRATIKIRYETAMKPFSLLRYEKTVKSNIVIDIYMAPSLVLTPRVHILAEVREAIPL